MMHAYHKELETGGFAYRRDTGDGVYFIPASSKLDAEANVFQTTIDVLILAEQIIPLLIRLFLLIFGNKEQKAEARLHHKAAREIGKAQKKWKE